MTVFEALAAPVRRDILALLRQGERAAMRLLVGDEAPFEPVRLIDPETR